MAAETAGPHHPTAEDGPEEAAEPLLTAEPLRALSLCRLPGGAGPTWERSLAAARATARIGSAEGLEQVLPGFMGLLDIGWAGRPVDGLDATGVADLVDAPDLLDQLFSQHHLGADRMHVCTAEGPQPVGVLGDAGLGFSLSRPHVEDVAAVVLGGGGIYLRAVDQHHRNLNLLMERVDRVLGEAARCDLALAGAGAGVSVPADHAGRLVVPLEGQAIVEAGSPVTPPGAPAPLPASFVVDPGQAVYLPPGWGHRLAGAQRSSLMLILGLPRLTMRAIAQGLAAEMVFWPLLRADLPHDRHQRHESYAGSVFESGGLAEALADLAEPSAVDRVLARRWAALPARWCGGLAETFAGIGDVGSAPVRCPWPGGFVLAEDQGDEGAEMARLVGAGRILETTAPVAEAIAVLADGRTHLGGELAVHAPDGRSGWVEDLLQQLVQSGLVEVGAP